MGMRDDSVDRVFAGCGTALSEVRTGVPGRVQNEIELGGVSNAVRGKDGKSCATYGKA